VPWEETAYPGEPIVRGVYTQMEVDPAGRILGLVDNGPTIVRTANNGADWTLHQGPTGILNGMESFGGLLYVSSKDNGLFATSDWSQWAPIALPGDKKKIEYIDGDKGILVVKIVGDNQFLFKSGADKDFVQVPSEVADVSGNAIAPNGSDEVLHLSAKGYWRYTISTGQWTRISDGMRANDMTVIKDSLYIGTVHEGSNTPYLAASKLDVINPLEMLISPGSGSMHFYRMYTMNDTVLVAWRHDNLIKADEIHYSFDRRELSPPLQKAGFSMTDMSLAPGKFYASTLEGLHVNTTNMFGNWTKLTTRLEANVAKHLITLSDKSVIAASSRGLIMRSTDGGGTWTEQNDLRKSPTLLAYTPAGTLLVGVPGQLLASRDLGRTFVGSDEGFSRRTPQAFAVGRNEKLFLGTDSGMFYSTDDGATWFRPRDTNILIVSPDRVLPQVYAIAIDPRDNGLYLGTNRGVLYSLNEGDKYESGWLARSPIYALAVNQYGEVFAGSLAINASDPNKRNFYRGWDVLNQQTAWIAPDTTINDFDVDKLMLNSKGQIISGMLFSGTSGDSWIFSEIEGIGSPKRVDAQTIDKEDIAYVSVGEKVYRSAGPKLNVPRDPSSLASYTMRIYPNPAANAFQFESGVEGEFVIYNTLGQSVLSSALAGEARSIDISHLPNGNYICQVTTSEGVSRVSLAIVH
jgi:photosystem II stability/assembly factor-like uncharacterized protein